MKMFLKNLTVVIIGAAILGGVYYFWLNKPKAPAAVDNPPDNGSEKVEAKPGVNLTDFPLKLPDNFQIEVFAKNLPGARVMEFDQQGNMWVSRTSAGRITLLEIKDNKVVSQNDVLRNLDNPHGRLYVSIGSSCNVCDEGDDRRAAIYSMNPDGSDFKQFATGLRNTVF